LLAIKLLRLLALIVLLKKDIERNEERYNKDCKNEQNDICFQTVT